MAGHKGSDSQESQNSNHKMFLKLLEEDRQKDKESK